MSKSDVHIPRSTHMYMLVTFHAIKLCSNILHMQSFKNYLKCLFYSVCKYVAHFRVYVYFGAIPFHKAVYYYFAHVVFQECKSCTYFAQFQVYVYFGAILCHKAVNRQRITSSRPD